MESGEVQADAPTDEVELSDADTIENDPPMPKRPKRQQPKGKGRPVDKSRSPPKPRESKERAAKAKPASGRGRPRKQPTRQQPKRKPPQRQKPKQPVSLTEDDVLDRWFKVRKERGFSGDADVARFLLSWYLDGLGAESKVGSRCGQCLSPLTLYCQKCRTSPNKTPDAVNATAMAPIRIKKEKKDAVDEELKVHFESTVVHNQSESSRNLNASKTRVKNSTNSHEVVNLSDGDDGGDIEDDDDDNDVDYSEEDDDDDEDYVKLPRKRGVAAPGRKRPANGKSAKYQKLRYICPFCNYESDKGEHTTHMKLHENLITTRTDKNEYKCTLCTRKFKVFEYLVKHRRMMVGTNRCNTCEDVVKSKCEIRAHRKMHWREDVQWCKWCQKSMKHMSEADFDQHLLNHQTRSGNKGKGKSAKSAEKAPALCSICGKSYKTKSLLDTHIAAGHGTERPFACEVTGCGLTFKIRKYLKRHMMFHEEKKQICEMCGQKFHREIELKYHMQKHFGKKYKCDECNRRFVSNYSLKVHVDSRHKGIKRYACTTCGTRFVAQNSLVIHMRGHTNERPFKCDQCDATFKLKPALDKHMLRHTAQKPFRCEDCGQAYRCNTSFRNHRKKYHSDSVYTCKVCGMSFHVPSSFNFHMRMYHNEVAFEEQLSQISTPTVSVQQQQQQPPLQHQEQQPQQQQQQHIHHQEQQPPPQQQLLHQQLQQQLQPQHQQQLQTMQQPQQQQLHQQQQQLQQLTPLEPASLQHMDDGVVTSQASNEVLKDGSVFFDL